MSWHTWLLAAGVLLAVPGSYAGAAVHRVPDEWASIQSAIDEAAPGDTVVIACGTYYEHDINVASDICLTSETGDPACVVVDAQRLGRVFHCDHVSSSTVMAGITITGGLTPGPIHTKGAGIYLSNSSPTIENCLITGNEASSNGGGVYCRLDSSPVIKDVHFGSNVAQMGGGVYCHWGSSPLLEDVVFVENTADLFGGGMCMQGDAEPTLTRVQFIRNVADFGGGARCDDASCPVFTDVVFEDNCAVQFAGGLNVMHTAWPVLTRTVFTGNEAGERGGALELFANAHLEMNECTIYANQAPQGSGIYFWGGGWPIVSNTIIAFGSGSPAMHFSGTELHPVFECCDIYGNEGGDWTGGIAELLGQSGNICADPQFCLQEFPEEPLSLSESSPCAPQGTPGCGQIGAFGVQCNYTTVERLSWGSIKALYR